VEVIPTKIVLNHHLDTSQDGYLNLSSSVTLLQSSYLIFYKSDVLDNSDGWL